MVFLFASLHLRKHFFSVTWYLYLHVYTCKNMFPVAACRSAAPCPQLKQASLTSPTVNWETHCMKILFIAIIKTCSYTNSSASSCSSSSCLVPQHLACAAPSHGEQLAACWSPLTARCLLLAAHFSLLAWCHSESNHHSCFPSQLITTPLTCPDAASL